MLWLVCVTLSAHRAARFHVLADNKYQAIDKVMKLKPALTGKHCRASQIAEGVIAL